VSNTKRGWCVEYEHPEVVLMWEDDEGWLYRIQASRKVMSTMDGDLPVESLYQIRATRRDGGRKKEGEILFNFHFTFL
jgi:hypothetical protein